MIDFHNHLLPGVDDGAATLEESRAAFAAMRDQGVTTVIVTPHLNAVELESPELFARHMAALGDAFREVETMVKAEFPGMELRRGVELMLDTPKPDLSDPRVRLAGTNSVLVEFPGLMVPPHSVQALYELRLQGWRPIVAHPERYRNIDSLGVVEEWRSVGCHIQLNAGSVLGRYGSTVEKAAWELLARGWVDYVCSDHHARGRLVLAEFRERLAACGGERAADHLLRGNASRLLEGHDPIPVGPVAQPKGLWRRILGGR